MSTCNALIFTALVTRTTNKFTENEGTKMLEISIARYETR